MNINIVFNVQTNMLKEMALKIFNDVNRSNQIKTSKIIMNLM